MKTTRHLIAILLVAFVALFAVKAGGQVSSFPFSIGTLQVVESNAVSHVDQVYFFIAAYNTDDKLTNFYANTAYILKPFTNKTQLDQGLIASVISDQLISLLNTTNKALKVERGLDVVISTALVTNASWSRAVFFTSHISVVPTNINGVLGVPNLSWFKTQMSSELPYYIPNQKHARLEVGEKGNPEPRWIYDGALYPETEILRSDGYMYLPPWATTNSSTATGLYWIKLYVTTKTTFQIFDGDGNLLPKTPVKVNYARSASTLAVYVSGGDPGQGFKLQQSTNNRSWTDSSPFAFISPYAHYSSNVISGEFVIPMTNNMASYKVILVNGDPY